jgi:DNA-binding HxlR family transcriptional regulator
MTGSRDRAITSGRFGDVPDQPKRRRPVAGSGHQDRRSAPAGSPTDVNSLGRGLLIVGDQSSMLVITEAFRHARRFQDFKERLDLADPVLASRLRDLVADGVLSTHQYSERPPRSEYRLTEQGQDLWTVFIAIWEWELRWSRPTAGHSPRLVHHDCGNSITPLFGCGACEAIGVTHRHTRASRRPGTTFAQSNPVRRYRRSSPRASDDAKPMSHTFLEVLGDRWTISLLGAGMLGLRRFGEFQRELEISPYLLSARLQSLVELDLMEHVLVSADGRRKEYRLLPKGLDMMPVFATTNAWANRWFPDPEGPALRIEHDVCGQPLEPAWWCNACGRRLERNAVHFEV